jgi:hypothetical protein
MMATLANIMLPARYLIQMAMSCFSMFQLIMEAGYSPLFQESSNQYFDVR